jgi:hypothetical protein
VFIEPDLDPLLFFLNFKPFDYVLVLFLKIFISRFNVEVRMTKVAANNEMIFLHNVSRLRVRLSERLMHRSLMLRLSGRHMHWKLMLGLIGRHMHRRLNHVWDLMRMVGRVNGARDHRIAWRKMVRIHVASWIGLDRMEIPWGIMRRHVRRMRHNRNPYWVWSRRMCIH